MSKTQAMILEFVMRCAAAKHCATVREVQMVMGFSSPYAAMQ